MPAGWLPAAELGTRIKAIRKARGETQLQFLVALGKPKMQSDLSRWERGVDAPSADTLIDIAELGGVDLHHFRAGQRMATGRRELFVTAGLLEKIARQIREQATALSEDQEIAEVVLRVRHGEEDPGGGDEGESRERG